MALAYSVRFSRCSAGAPGLGPRPRGAIERRPPRRRRSRRASARSGRGAPLGGIMPVRTLRTTFSHVCGSRPACATSSLSSEQAAGLHPRVVAGDAVAIDHARWASGAGRLLAPAAPVRPWPCVVHASRARLRGVCRPRRRHGSTVSGASAAAQSRVAACAIRGSRDQLFEQRDRRRLALGADGGQEHALGPAQRRAAFLVLDVEPRAASAPAAR